MDDFDIPILRKTLDLYKAIYALRVSVSKQDRYTLWLRVENSCLDVVEGLLQSTALYKGEKLPALNVVSTKLNLLRFFVRLARETRVIDTKKYILLQQPIDEIGRMLGGWIKSVKTE